MKSVVVIQCTDLDLYESRNPDDYCISALKKSGIFDAITLAVPKIGDYRVFDELSRLWNVDVYFGENYNVAERLYSASRRYSPSMIVRVLLKRFYIDLDLVEHMMKKLYEGYDYINLGNDVNYELSADIFSFFALERAVNFLKKLDNSYSSDAFRFSPWTFMEQRPEFKVFTLDYSQKWEKNRIEDVKKKLKALFERDENKQALSINNPASRYRFVGQFIEKDDTVLDIACGQGGGSALLAKLSKFVCGVDYNLAYIEHARKRYDRANLKFEVGTHKTLNRFGVQFDKIVSLHTMEHVEDDVCFLRTLGSHLKPEGKLIIEVPRLLLYPLGEPLWPFHKREYARSDLENLLESTGFEIETALGGNRHTYVGIEDAREVLFYVCKKT